MQRGEVRNPIIVFILPMFTCGLYGLYWFYTVVEEVNAALGREEFNFVKEFALSIVTCGAWGIYFSWRFSEAIVEVQQQWGVQPTMDAPILFITYIFGFGPVLTQLALNNAWENGTPGGTGYGAGGGQF